MQVVRRGEDKPPPPEGTVCTIGTFDAVHLGHQALLGRVVDDAGSLGAVPALVTFDRHPLEVLRPEAAPCRLGSLDQRLERFAEAGIGRTLVLHFDLDLSSLEPEAFVELILIGELHVRKVVVGDDFRFGHRRRGDVELLRRMGAAHGFDVRALGLVAAGGKPISSTHIRRLVGEGNLAEVSRLLGRSYRLEGTVVRGAERGRGLGYPTANIEAHARSCLPGTGVYAGWWVWRGQRHPGVINVGVRPTFEQGAEPITEIHVFDFSGDLYGERGEVEFTARLRDEVRFDSAEALIEQMHADAAQARELLAREASELR